MSSAAAASVPGKTILFGEHAAVYGNPALVTALDRRMSVVCRAEVPGRGSIRLNAGTYRVTRRYDAEEIKSILRRVTPLDPGDLAVTAAAIASGDFKGDLELHVESAIPAGAGFGSSAALAVGVVAACRRAIGRPAETEEIAMIAHHVERMQHVHPSGIDVRAVLHGGALWCRRTPSGLDHEAATVGPRALASIRLFDTGTPAESTGEMVATVRSLKEREPERIEDALDLLAVAAYEGREALAHDDVDALIDAMRQAHDGLTALDVVHPEVRAVIARIEAEGGAAKVSGAGGTRGAGSGLVLVVHPGFVAPSHWIAHDVALGAPGLREEVAV